MLHAEQVLVVRGQGMPRRGRPGQFGDLHVTVTVKFPAFLTGAQLDSACHLVCCPLPTFLMRLGCPLSPSCVSSCREDIPGRAWAGASVTKMIAVTLASSACVLLCSVVLHPPTD